MITQVRQFAAAVTAFACTSLFSVGCGDETHVTVAQPASPGVPAQAPPNPAPTTVTIQITQIFKPTPIIIHQNVVKIATIVIVNNHTSKHSIVADHGKFHTGIIDEGESVTIVIDEPGDYPFHCGVHPDDPNERGIVHVEPPAEQNLPSPSPSASPSPLLTVSPVPTAVPSTSPTPTGSITIPVGASTRTSDAFGSSPINAVQNSRVTVVNNDTVAHTATADDGSFDTGIIPPGQSATIVLNQAGDIVFHCTIHPNMKGTLHVAGAALLPSPSPTL